MNRSQILAKLEASIEVLKKAGLSDADFAAEVATIVQQTSTNLSIYLAKRPSYLSEYHPDQEWWKSAANGLRPVISTVADTVWCLRQIEHKNPAGGAH